MKPLDELIDLDDPGMPVERACLSQFYQGLRWDSWQQDMRQVSANQCISFYPFLWTEEGNVATSRRIDLPSAFKSR